jgi:hypothetical protein
MLLERNEANWETKPPQDTAALSLKNCKLSRSSASFYIGQRLFHSRKRNNANSYRGLLYRHDKQARRKHEAILKFATFTQNIWILNVRRGRRLYKKNAYFSYSGRWCVVVTCSGREEGMTVPQFLGFTEICGIYVFLLLIFSSRNFTSQFKHSLNRWHTACNVLNLFQNKLMVNVCKGDWYIFFSESLF